MNGFKQFCEMAAQYTPISQDEMEQFLSTLGFYPKPMNTINDPGTGEPLIPPNVQELVYGKRQNSNGMPFSIRVYTGINKYGGESREKGKDAIRVEVHYKDESGKPQRLGGSKRVHRTQNWRDNLRQRIVEWEQTIATTKIGPTPICPVCKEPAVRRKGKNGMFWGCRNYPRCQGRPSQDRPQNPMPSPTNTRPQTPIRKTDIRPPASPGRPDHLSF